MSLTLLLLLAGSAASDDIIDAFVSSPSVLSPSGDVCSSPVLSDSSSIMEVTPTASDIAMAELATSSSSAPSVPADQPRPQRSRPSSLFKKVLPHVGCKPARMDSALSPPQRKSTAPYPPGKPRRKPSNPS